MIRTHLSIKVVRIVPKLLQPVVYKQTEVVCFYRYYFYTRIIVFFVLLSFIIPMMSLPALYRLRIFVSLFSFNTTLFCDTFSTYQRLDPIFQILLLQCPRPNIVILIIILKCQAIS